MSEENKEQQEQQIQDLEDNENNQMSEEQLQFDQSQVDKDRGLQQKGQGYKYWADPTKQDPNYKPKQPKKIDPNQLNQQNGQENNNKPKASAWNTSGTWEERSVKVDILQPFLEKVFNNNNEQDKKVLSKDGLIEFIDIQKLEGSLSMVFRKSKWVPGYELSINIGYQGVKSLEGAKGSLKFTDFHDDGDFEFTIECSEDSEEKFKAESFSSIHASLEHVQAIVKAAILDLACH